MAVSLSRLFMSYQYIAHSTIRLFRQLAVLHRGSSDYLLRHPRYLHPPRLSYDFSELPFPRRVSTCCSPDAERFWLGRRWRRRRSPRGETRKWPEAGFDRLEGVLHGGFPHKHGPRPIIQRVLPDLERDHGLRHNRLATALCSSVGLCNPCCLRSKQVNTF